MSLINNMKISVDRIEPWGVPAVINFWEDETPLHLTI